MNKSKKILLFMATLILLTVFLFSALNLINIIIEYNEANSLYEDIQEKYVETIATENTEPVTIDIESTEKQTNPPSPPISIDFSKLTAENEDIVGWIYSQDTPINYPVVQTNNNSKYLHSDLNGNYLINGTIFVDYRNQEIGKDLNYIVYGHSMNNESMFGSLLNYKEQSYYESHPTIYYLTDIADYRIELIAGLVVSTDELIYQTTPDLDNLESYIKQARENSSFKSNTKYQVGDNIITLSTCTYEYDDARYVLIGKLIML